MFQFISQTYNSAATVITLFPATEAPLVQPMTTADEAEVLAFLAARPIHTVMLSGLIRDNGMESPLNRGTFYGCRNRAGHLEGVALIGHATLIETRTDRALEEFAGIAQEYSQAHLILGEPERIEEFWRYYADAGQARRLVCRELLFELRPTVEARLGEATGLRPATLDELELVVPVQAEMALAESGVNPLEKDPTGFRQRCARRIEMGRTWVLVAEGKLLFKADIMSETPEVIYLEGIYANPDERGKGLGLRCMSQLGQVLLRRSNSICLLVNEQNTSAQDFYRKAGYEFQSCYDTIFLEQFANQCTAG